MKLIKIKDDHYVIVDDSKIEVGDWYIDDAKQIRRSVVSDEVYWQHRPYNREYMKITHSTEPLAPIKELIEKGYDNILPLDIDKVKELIGEVDVKKKGENYAKDGLVIDTPYANGLFYGYIKGYNQALEDNKDKKYTEKQLIWAIQEAYGHGQDDEFDGVNKVEESIKTIIEFLQAKTQWEIEIIDGKLKMV